MRAIAILIVLAVLGFFGYEYAANGRSPAEAIGVLTGQTAADEAAAAAEAEAAAIAAQDAVAAQAAAAEEAAAAAVAAAQEAAAAAAAEVEAAAQAAAAAAQAAMDSAAEAVQDATQAATGDVAAEAEVTVAEPEVTAAAPEDATDDAPMALLTVDGFDVDKVMEMIQNADISMLEKTTLGSAVTAAKDNPELLAPVLEQLRTVLGE